jgi:hypothetical protein
MSWIMQAMRRAFSLCRHCDLDIRIITYAGQIDPQLVAIEQEFAACVPKSLATKRDREEESYAAEEKRLKSSEASMTTKNVVAKTDASFCEASKAFVETSPPTKTSTKSTTSVLESPPKDQICQTSAKRSRGKGGNEKKSVALEDAILQEAEKLGLAGPLKNLASRPEFVSGKVSQLAMLDALKRTDGLVNKAKHVLLSA